MIAYNHPNTLTREIFIGYYPKDFYEAMLWENKRQDEGDCGPRSLRGLMTFATFLDRQEVIDANFIIQEDVDLPPSADESGEADDGPGEAAGPLGSPLPA
jgi:hypothetical protein